MLGAEPSSKGTAQRGRFGQAKARGTRPQPRTQAAQVDGEEFAAWGRHDKAGLTVRPLWQPGSEGHDSLPQRHEIDVAALVLDLVQPGNRPLEPGAGGVGLGEQSDP